MSGTPVSINDLPDLAGGVVDADFAVVWDTSGSVTRKVNRAYLVGASITGGGTIALGGRTLTVPASGTAALLEVANSFTETLTVTGVGKDVVIASGDNGAGAGGSVAIRRNLNASTPAPGNIAFQKASSSYSFLWSDDANLIRTNTAAPTNATMTGGTVIGSQTSHESFKTVVGDSLPVAQALLALTAAAAATRRFVYTIDQEVYGESAEEYDGLILHEDQPITHRYGTDKREEGYSAGKSLNTITLLGDLLRVVVDLAQRVESLEAGIASPRDGGA